MSEDKPEFMQNNPWLGILSERGKPPKTGIAPKDQAQIQESPGVIGPLKGSRRNIQRRRLLVLRLAALGLDAEEIKVALASQGVTMGVSSIYYDLSVLRRQLTSVDKKNLDYSVGFAFAELTVLWREGWISYHNPDLEAGFLKLGVLRELRHLHRSKTRLAGLEAEPGMQLTAVMSPTWMGVQITMSGQPGNIDDIVRDGGIEYAARFQDPAKNND